MAASVKWLGNLGIAAKSVALALGQLIDHVGAIGWWYRVAAAESLSDLIDAALERLR